jgi:hypothetical protein
MDVAHRQAGVRYNQCMVVLTWVDMNWFNLLQSGGIIASLLVSAAALRLDANARRTGNLLEITENHREIWSYLYTHPELSRVLDASVDLKRVPVTTEEELFVNFLVLHLNSAFYAMKKDVYVKPEGLRRDIQLFFSLPIPDAVWEKVKALQEEDFVRFVESNRVSP